MSCMGRAGGDGLSAAGLPPLSSRSPPSFCHCTHPASSCRGTSLARNWLDGHQPQKTSSRVGGRRHPPRLPPTIIREQPQQRVLPWMGANKAQHEIEHWVAMTARQRKAVGVWCTASHLQCTDWRSVFSRLPMRDCTSWICLWHTPEYHVSAWGLAHAKIHTTQVNWDGFLIKWSHRRTSKRNN